MIYIDEQYECVKKSSQFTRNFMENFNEDSDEQYECVKKTSQFTRNFMENFNEDSDEQYFLEPDFWYHKKLHELDNDLIFLSERIKIKKV